MQMSKAIAGAALALAALTAMAAAQEWPARTIALVVPFAAGGGIDASARLQAAALGEVLGQTIIVENVGAAAGTVGSARVAKAAPDGYTLLIGNTGTHAYSQSLYKKPPYDAARDFEPVGLVSESPRILIVRKDLAVNTLQEFIAYEGTPQPIVRKMNKALGEMMARPDLREKLEALGLSIVPAEQRSPEYLARFLPEEIERWGKVIRASAVSMD